MRQAQSRLPDGTIVERDWTLRELYMLYMRGWADGASFRALRKDAYDLEPYLRGYNDGLLARRAAASAYAAELGYEPTVLRTCEPNSYPGREPGADAGGSHRRKRGGSDVPT